eukprot:gene1508-1664_t
MLVFDEAHKIFDRHDDFRRAYSTLANIHDVFPGIPVVTLTATLTQRDLETLATEYLHNPI